MFIGKTKNILQEDIPLVEKYLYLERFVNNGSPSGFTFINSTSLGTRPFDKNDYIEIYKVTFKKPYKVKRFGSGINFIKEGEMLIHPDMFDAYKEYVSSFEKIEAIPLASMRTVYIPSFNVFAKLQYDKMIGRIDRAVNYQRANHSFAINSLLEKHYQRRNGQYFLYECQSDIAELNNKTIGVTYRTTIDDGLLIPAFSLFGKDMNNAENDTILCQLLKNVENDNKDTFIFAKLLKPAIELFFDMLLNFGLLIEAHAQNILYLLKDKQIKGIVLRDFESIDKDYSFKKEYNSYFDKSYKCYEKSHPDYVKRHSFMFDFKLGEYLISPIIEESSKNGCSSEHLFDMCKELSQKYINLLPQGYFPKERWYSLKPGLIDRSKATREYVSNANSKIR